MPRPAALIHLGAFFWPTKLRPDLRVASESAALLCLARDGPYGAYASAAGAQLSLGINSLDYAGLRRAGFNAVVIDKDNCVTPPKSDQVWPAFAPGWERLQRAFAPGRVLVVSNSSGTRKDPGGIGAELLSRSLRAPVLIHAAPKPACAALVLAYFADQLGPPRTLHPPSQALRRVLSEEESDEAALVRRWKDEVEGPLCGARVGRGWNRFHGRGEGGEVDGRDVEEKMVDAENAAAARAKEAREKKGEGAGEGGADVAAEDEHEGGDRRAAKRGAAVGDGNGADAGEPLRILVIGDRLFTDTLLAQQLRRLLPRPERGARRAPARPAVLAVHTTELPVRDVGALRWLETTLSRGRTARAEVDWAAFDLDRARERAAAGGAAARARWGPAAWLGAARDRVRRLDPRTWPAPVADWRRPATWAYPLAYYVTLYAGRAAGWAGARAAVGARWAWARAGRAWTEYRQRAGTAAAVVEQK